MINNFKKAVMVVMAIVIIGMAFAVPAMATETVDTTDAAETTMVSTQLELRTESLLLVDRSGSMEDKGAVNSILAEIDQSVYDAVYFFDSNGLSKDSSYPGGGDSNICEVIHKAIAGGYTHIDVITDGQQWPQNYSALGIYTDADIRLFLVEGKTADAESMIGQLSNRLSNSSLKVVTPNGEEEIILDDYRPPVYPIELDIPLNNQDMNLNEENVTIVECNHQCTPCNCKSNAFGWGNWWWWIPLLVFLLLLPFLFWMISASRRNKEKEQEAQNPPTHVGMQRMGEMQRIGGVQPVECSELAVPVMRENVQPVVIPEKAVQAIADCDAVLIDCSSSMDAVMRAAIGVCIATQTKSDIITFGGNGVEVRKLDDINNLIASGQTPGWEAVEVACQHGCKSLTIITDGGFNRMHFEEVDSGVHFEKVTTVGCCSQTVEQIRSIADEVEELPLQ